LLLQSDALAKLRQFADLQIGLENSKLQIPDRQFSLLHDDSVTCLESARSATARRFGL
jgi:hypothetical protein